jgi:hypothetical protein
MSLELVLYDSPQFEHASVAVLFCQKVLRNQGFEVEASKLEGIDVTCPAMGRVALNVLNRLRHVKGPAAEYVGIARHLCEQALGPQVLRAAS